MSSYNAAKRERVLRDYEFVYEPELTEDSSYWSHDCGSFYGGGEDALHEAGCSAKGYVGCTYHFGPAEIKEVKAAAERTQDEDYAPRGVLSLTILKTKFPELV